MNVERRELMAEDGVGRADDLSEEHFDTAELLCSVEAVAEDENADDSTLEGDLVDEKGFASLEGASGASCAAFAASLSSRSDLPTLTELEGELKRVKGRHRFRKALFSVLGVLVVVSAAAVLVATLFMPVMQIYGNSMTPTLEDGDIVVALDTTDLETGDVVAFYYNNKVLVKRVIAESGDWVNISESGVVTVNGVVLDEPYIEEMALGNCNIEFPYQVPESRVFVLGDHRSVSIDSRNTAVGCIEDSQIVGKLVLRIWPLEDIEVL